MDSINKASQKSYIESEIKKTSHVLDIIVSDQDFIKNIENIVASIVKSFKAGGKVFLAGNGGSAADAQHIAGEFVSRFMFDRPGLPAIALTTDTSVLTAVGNDYGYEHVFSRQIDALANKGDVFFGYSTSGQSKNILNALQHAKNKELICIGLAGSKGAVMKEFCDYIVEIPSSETPHIQEGHLVVGHIICGLVESIIFKKESDA